MRNVFMLDRSFKTAYTNTTTDRENRRFVSADIKSMFSLFVYMNNYITYLVDTRNITCYDKIVVRKGNTVKCQ